MSNNKNGAAVEPDAQGIEEDVIGEVVILEEEMTIDDLLKMVEFDVETITAKEYAEIDKHRTEESKYMPMLLAKVVTKAPKAWGVVSQVETWQKLQKLALKKPCSRARCNPFTSRLYPIFL